MKEYEKELLVYLRMTASCLLSICGEMMIKRWCNEEFINKELEKIAKQAREPYNKEENKISQGLDFGE